MSIDEYGRRRDFNIRLIDFRSPNPSQIGFWSPNSGGVQLTQTEHELESYLYKSIKDKHFKISTRIVRDLILITNSNNKTIA